MELLSYVGVYIQCKNILSPPLNKSTSFPQVNKVGLNPGGGRGVTSMIM
jgi:hypothetical protein